MPMPSDAEGEVGAEAEASEGGANVQAEVSVVRYVGVPSNHYWKRGEASEGGAHGKAEVNEVQGIGAPSNHYWKRGRDTPHAFTRRCKRV